VHFVARRTVIRCMMPKSKFFCRAALWSLWHEADFTRSPGLVRSLGAPVQAAPRPGGSVDLVPNRQAFAGGACEDMKASQLLRRCNY
jgi:hypothetical protein